MPIHEPDAADPLELLAVGAEEPDAGDAAFLARCLSEEFLGLGRTPREVLDLFRSAEYPLAHRAWLELGEVKLFAIVSEIASRGGRRA